MVIPQKIIIQKVVVEQRWKVQPNVVPKTNRKGPVDLGLEPTEAERRHEKAYRR